MKQKYTINVADMELNIVSDASPEDVENAVGMLDRRIRDIHLKSPRCSKTEAAILCALSYGSEKAAMQATFRKMERDALRNAGEIDRLKHQIELLQAENDRLKAEMQKRNASPSLTTGGEQQSIFPEGKMQSAEDLKELQKRNRMDGMFRLLTEENSNDHEK